MMAWLVVFTAAFSAVGTGALMSYARARRFLDVPNARSSHSVPTPRGGGVAILVSFLAGLFLATATGVFPWQSAVALAGGALIVGVVGFMDDIESLDAHWRLLAHFAAGAWGVAWLGGLPPIALSGGTLDLGIAGHVIAIVGIVWMVNLYNFMDGIDGLAAMEAMTVCLGMIGVVHFADLAPAFAGMHALLAAAALGFLVWNLPPAKIFMGDAGSGFLGLVLGLFAVQSARGEPRLLWSWAILLGVFIVDATVTLLRRAARGDRVVLAHRSHAYQHAAIRIGRHGPVTAAVLAVNALWLWPLAWLVADDRMSGLAGVAAAYAPLVAIAVMLKAGEPGEASSPSDTGERPSGGDQQFRTVAVGPADATSRSSQILADPSRATGGSSAGPSMTGS